jgi:hypothetical protein
MPVLTATPSALKNAKACLNCVSEKRLKAIIVYSMRTYSGLTLAQLVANSACYMCLSKKDMLVALTAMIANQLVPGMTGRDLDALVPCKICDSDKQLEAMMLYLFANYFQQTAV